jgi:CRISPR system Cascade subunit CasA
MPLTSVADDPWIPVSVRADAPPDELERLLPGATPGAAHTTGLRGVLTAAHLLEDLAIPQPPLEASVRRLLAALTARLTGLDRREGWDAHRAAVLDKGRIDPDTARGYFDQWAHRLRLFDAERPWLQDPRLEAECGAAGPAARIDMTRPSGANAWWDPRIPADSPVAAADAAGWLLTWHGYAASGLGARRTHGGRTNGSAKAAPYRGFLAVWPHVPGDMFTSLVVSLPSPADWPPAGDGADHAPWEAATLPNPLAPAAPTGVVSLLTARTTQAVLLRANSAGDAARVWCAWGSAGELPQARDPYLIHRSETGPVRAVSGVGAWREMPALLNPRAARGKLTAYRPTALNAAATLPDAVRARVGLRVIGWEQERQERNRAWWTETLPAVMAHCAEANPAAAERAVRLTRAASLQAGALGKALAGVWISVHPSAETRQRQALLGPAVADFYRRAGPHVLRALADGEYRPPWRHLTRAVFNTHAAGMARAPHHLAAAAKARAALTKAPLDD